MTSLKNIVYENLESYRYSDMETVFNPKDMGSEDWRDFYNELVYIQGYRGLIMSKQVWCSYINGDNVNVKQNDDSDCSICLDLFNKAVAVLSCGHLFHFECICRWYIIKNYKKMCDNPKIFCKEFPTISCPICRENTIINRIYKKCPEYIYVKKHIEKKTGDNIKTNSKETPNKHSKKSNIDKFKISKYDLEFKKNLEERLKYMIHNFSHYNKEYDRRLVAYETAQIAIVLDQQDRRNAVVNHPYYDYQDRRRRNRRSSSCTIC